MSSTKRISSILPYGEPHTRTCDSDVHCDSGAAGGSATGMIHNSSGGGGVYGWEREKQVAGREHQPTAGSVCRRPVGCRGQEDAHPVHARNDQRCLCRVDWVVVVGSTLVHRLGITAPSGTTHLPKKWGDRPDRGWARRHHLPPCPFHRMPQALQSPPAITLSGIGLSVNVRAV